MFIAEYKYIILPKLCSAKDTIFVSIFVPVTHVNI